MSNPFFTDTELATYLLAQTAVRKLFGPYEGELLTREEKQALLTVIPELRQFAEVSMS